MSAQTYTGGCQCGAVRYEVSLELGEVIACNCSRCGRLGSLLAFAPAQQFKLISGEGALTEYQFNKHVIHHLFCSTCGIQSFARGKRPSDGADVVAVNARCLDGVEPEKLKVKHVNGRAF
ncbi:MAG: GFA family protein [Alphaproteobacteria bacterium]|nr:MAG: GFA family protein [Alphaproteobacteria bacterium]